MTDGQTDRQTDTFAIGRTVCILQRGKNSRNDCITKQKLRYRYGEAGIVASGVCPCVCLSVREELKNNISEIDET